MKTILLALLLFFVGLGVKAQDTLKYSSIRQLIVPTAAEQYYEDSSYDLMLYKGSGAKYLSIRKGKREEIYTVDNLIQVDSAMQIDSQHSGLLFIFSATRVSPEWDNIGIQVAIFRTEEDIQAIGIGDVINIKVYSVTRKEDKKLQP